MAEDRTAIYGIVAREARTAVVFRRGPSKHVRLIRWDLSCDRLTLGQWLVGRAYAGPSGLSPNGELLVYYARKQGETFTALSRPPYFTALAHWPNDSPWTGGGFFPSDRCLVLGLDYDDPRDGHDVPADFEITSVWKHYRGDPEFPNWGAIIPRERDANHGWRAREPGVQYKPNPTRARFVLTRRSGRGTFEYALAEGRDDGQRTVRSLDHLGWADWDHDGTMLFSAGRRLYRQSNPARFGAPATAATLVADLSEQAFESMPPPNEALRWPAGIRGRRSRR